jgi:hypothetical protein
MRRAGEPERAALIFLPFAIALTQFAPFTAENYARNILGRPLADWKSDSFSYRAHLPFDSQVATLPLTPAQQSSEY